MQVTFGTYCIYVLLNPPSKGLEIARITHCSWIPRRVKYYRFPFTYYTALSRTTITCSRGHASLNSTVIFQDVQWAEGENLDDPREILRVWKQLEGSPLSEHSITHVVQYLQHDGSDSVVILFCYIKYRATILTVTSTITNVILILYFLRSYFLPFFFLPRSFLFLFISSYFPSYLSIFLFILFSFCFLPCNQFLSHIFCSVYLSLLVFDSSIDNVLLCLTVYVV
jgi:hypothetical protein